MQGYPQQYMLAPQPQPIKQYSPQYAAQVIPTYPAAPAPAADADPVIYINQDSSIPGQTFKLLSRSRPVRGNNASPYAAQYPGMENVPFDQFQGQYAAVPPFPGVPQQGFMDPFPYSQPAQGYSDGSQQGQQQQGQDQYGYGQQQQGYGYDQQQQGAYGGQFDIPQEQSGGARHLSRDEKDKKARAVFKKYDKDGNGFMDIYEFLQAMNHLGADLTYGDAQGIFAAFDDSQQNCITIDQFAANFCANY